jgi:hypothetical protein
VACRDNLETELAAQRKALIAQECQSSAIGNRRLPHPVSLPSTNRGVPHISLVFREMWDTTTLNLF